MLERVATWCEVRDSWSLDDLLDAHEALDLWIKASAHKGKTDDRR